MKPVFKSLQESSPCLSAGILSANLLSLGNEVVHLESTEISLIHFDVMDGVFTPSMTVGVPFIRSIKSRLLKDVHLMIKDPLEKVEDFILSGADIITVHAESCNDLVPVFDRIRMCKNSNDPERGVLVGLALNPGTSQTILERYLKEIDLVLILGVDPTQKKMKMMPYEWIQERFFSVRKITSLAPREILLGYDGGVTLENILGIAELNPDIVVSGSALFKNGNLKGNVSSMKQTLTLRVKGSYLCH